MIITLGFGLNIMTFHTKRNDRQNYNAEKFGLRLFSFNLKSIHYIDPQMNSSVNVVSCIPIVNRISTMMKMLLCDWCAFCIESSNGENVKLFHSCLSSKHKLVNDRACITLHYIYIYKYSYKKVDKPVLLMIVICSIYKNIFKYSFLAWYFIVILMTIIAFA